MNVLFSVDPHCREAEMSDQEESDTKSLATAELNNDDHEPAKQKLNKNQKRKLRNKRKKLERKQIKIERESIAAESNGDKENNYDADDEKVEIEYVPEKLEFEDSSLAAYFKVFERFSTEPSPVSNEQTKNESADDEELKQRLLERKKPQEFELKEEEENEDGESKISKRKLKVK